MKEGIIGVIPQVNIDDAFATWYFTMFITPKRIVIIKTGWDYIWGWSLYSDIINNLRVKKRREAVKEFNLDTLLADDRWNKEIPLEKLTEINIKKNVINRYRIDIFGIDKKNIKKKLFNGYFALPDQQIRELKGDKQQLKTVLYEYVINCQKQIEEIFGEKLTQKIK